MGVFQFGEQKNVTKVIILLITIFFCDTHSQLNCSNYYSEANLPQQCNNLTLTCIFPPFTNTTLISNTTSSNQYSLCLDLPQYNIEVQEGKDLFQDSLYVNSNSATFDSGYTLQSLESLILIAVSSIILNNVTIWGQNVWLQSTIIQLYNATIYNEGSFETNCDCTTKGTVCISPNYYFPFLFNSLRLSSSFDMNLMNYTFQTWIYAGLKVNSVVIFANSYALISNSTIKISSIAIYTPNLTIVNSQLNNTGLGYSSGTGLGCGYFDQVLNQLLGCTGTGASHGGYGGSSGPESCNLLMSQPPYDRDLIPKYPGSGGGFFLKELVQVSSGGGVINIQTNMLIIQNSILLANGISGIQGGGGGSGGSISIDFMNSNTFGSIVISVNGGDGKSSGGGGRIRYYNHNWTTISENIDTQNVLIQAFGGSGCQGLLTCGQNGSIIASPCPPGYQLSLTNFGCILCPTGKFQISYGYDECSPCGIKPANSYYKVPTNQNWLNNFTYVCSFNCNNGADGSPAYQLYNGKECLNSFNFILADVGGINLLICIGIIVGTLVIFLVILMVRKLSLTDKSIFQQNQHIDIYKKKSHFKIQDIPFHETRIYFQGINTPNSPWQIHQYVSDKLCQLQQYNAALPFFSKLIRQLNQIGRYNRATKWLLSALTVCYYPLGLFLASVFRQNKAKKMRNTIVSICKQNCEANMGIKIHVNQQFTVGSLQIFNYKKQTLDFYIKNYFPIYFKLQRLHSGGYAIDFTDPIFKALCIQFEQKNDKNQKLQDYLIQLNQLLRNCDQTLSIFKHLWKVNAAWPSLQCHLWQPQNSILGIDDNLQINKKIDLFLAFCTQARIQTNHSHGNINQTLPLSSYSSQQGGRIAQSKYNKHFLYKCQLPNIFFDQITSIRHKYHLKEIMIEMDEKRTVFWQIQNSFSQKSLSWILGTFTILQLLLDLLSFFLVIFLLVDDKNILLYAFIPYFALFPFCQFFMIFLSFSLLISKRAKIFTFSLYFTLFSLIKYGILSIIILILIITLSNGFDDNILVINFFIWLIIFIFNVISLVLLCMLHLHYGKIK